MVVVELKDCKFYVDGWLDKKLETGRTIVNKNDEDLVIAIDGEEGTGKSVFSFQVAKKLDPTFCVDRVAMNAVQFRECVMRAKKGQAIVYDEAFTGLSSRGALSEVNKLLVELMMEMRQKNLFIVIVLPTFFLLDRYVALWRARALFHVYRKNGKRGYWIHFDKKGKKLLYLYGKKNYTYTHKNIPMSRRRGRFYNQYAISEKVYRRKKSESFQDKTRVTRNEVLMDQRDRLFLIFHEKYNLSIRDVVKLCKDFGLKIGASTIGDLLIKVKEKVNVERQLNEIKDKK